MSNNPTIKYPDGAVLVTFDNSLPDPEKTTKLELFLHSHTLEDQSKFELPVERPVFPAPVPVVKKQRTKRVWQPRERERAILSLPAGRKRMYEYCQSLDNMGVPFPEKWQRKGQPKNHVAAWDSKDDRLRNNLESERNNTWTRMKKG